MAAAAVHISTGLCSQARHTATTGPPGFSGEELQTQSDLRFFTSEICVSGFHLQTHRVQFRLIIISFCKCLPQQLDV